MSDKEPPAWSVRNVSQAARDAAAAAAARRGRMNMGLWLEEAIYAHIAREREPIGQQPPADSNPMDALAMMVQLESWARNAAFRASLRGGKRQGQIPGRDRQAFSRIYDAAVRRLSDMSDALVIAPAASDKSDNQALSDKSDKPVLRLTASGNSRSPAALPGDAPPRA